MTPSDRSRPARRFRNVRPGANPLFFFFAVLFLSLVLALAPASVRAQDAPAGGAAGATSGAEAGQGGAAQSQAQSLSESESAPAANADLAGATLSVATNEAPPFAMKEADGEWTGLSIWLWRSIGEELGFETRFVEATVPEMIENVATGRFDAAVAALTITAVREEQVDFSQPFYTTGYGIAVAAGGGGWFSTIRAIFTWGFVQAVLALAALLAALGILFWLAERRVNREEFGGSPLRGIGSGFWFAAVTMTTVGYGDKAPRSKLGRLIALVWMFGAILLISTFTGAIASALTADELTNQITGPNDLANVSVGSIAETSSDDWLAENRIGFTGFENVRAGLEALSRGGIDAFVYDRPLLRYRVNQEFADTLAVLPGTYGRQDYGIALPEGSSRREPIDRALRSIVQSEAWTNRVFQALGNPE